MRALALAALLLGQDSLDPLLRGLSDDDPSGRDKAARLILDRWEKWTDAELGRLGKAAEAPDADLAGRARDVLGRIVLRREMGAALLAAEPDLERTVRQGPERERAALLARMVRQAQAGAIGEDRVRLLAERAARERWFRGALPQALEAAARESRPLAPIVAGLLQDDGTVARHFAADTLGRMGAREHAPAIARLLDDPDESVAGAALTALNRLAALDQFGRIVPLLARPRLREPAVEVLAQTLARPMTDGVAALLGSPDLETRGAAASALGGMGAHEHAGAVAALLGSDDAPLLVKAAVALGRMGAAGEAERVAGLLRHDDPFVRAAAAQALGRMRDPRWAPPLLPLLRDVHTDVREAATAALGGLGARETLPEVAKLLVDRDAGLRGFSARILGEAGARDRAREIAQVLGWEHPWSRTRAIRALGGLGAAEHLDTIIALTKDEWDVVRVSSAAALCELSPLPWPGEKKAAALANLREIRKDPGDEVQHAAAAALVVLEGGGPAAQREVLALLDERDAAETIPVLLDALARVHEKKAREALDREIAVERPVDSIERVREELAKAGLALDGTDDPRVAGRLPGGLRTTPRRLLASVWEGTLAVPRGDRVRVLDPMRALEHWKGRLEAAKR